MSVLGDVTLEQLRHAFIGRKPSHATLEPGWASMDNTSSNINVRNAAPPSTDPEFLPAAGHHPRRLAARYYYFQTNRQLQRNFPDGSPQEQHVVGAFDVLASDAGPDRLMLLLSSRSPAAAGKLIKDLRQIIADIDESARLEIDGGPLAFTPDLFFWLIVRARDNQQLNATTSLDAVLAVNGHDKTNRATLLSDGVDFNRPALLVAVAEIEQLGPVRISLRSTSLNAKVTADVWATGTFSVLKGQTHYSDQVDSPEQRLESIQDFAYELLPELIRVYTNDAEADWGDTRRQEEILSAARDIVARYRRLYPELDVDEQI